MEQHTGSQYDDDLTVGMDEYDSLQTGNVDLFEFVGDEESPITRLKTIILSIDWEISDDILRQFNIELLDLKDIWANDKINLVYVQALEKISKYIFQEKANANPNAIKLLLNFYSNLEKIVSTESMPEEEKKRLLMEDVEKFEKLKKQISRSSEKTQVRKTGTETILKTAPAFRMDEPLPTDGEHEDPLLNLKAIVFGMDWEITEADLNNLGEEVRRLEKRFSNSKAKLIFLQGIGALGAYINLKRSNAHADAFKLLHSFFLSLENCVRNGLTGEDEKRLLMPQVEKFNAFKAAIAFTLSPEAIAAEGGGEEDIAAGSSGAGSDLAPAFADLPEEVHGFQEEEEAASLGSDAQQKVDGQIDRFFEDEKTTSGEGAGDKAFPDSSKSELIGEMESRLQGFFGDDSTLQQQSGGTSEDVALQGVVVETEADDDSDEEALPRLGDELAPALSENIEESSFSEEAIAGELAATGPSSDMDDRVAGIFSAPDETQDIGDISAALQGVEVETEADDDADEEPLPRRDEELAPALFALEDETEEVSERDLPLPEESLGIEGRLADFFDDHVVSAPVVDDQIALRGVDVGTEEEETSEEDMSSKEEFSPAVYSLEEDTTEEVLRSSVFQEEEVPKVDDQSRVFIADDSTRISGDLEVEDVSLGDETGKDSDVEGQLVSFQDAEQAAIISKSEENLFFDAEEKLPEEELSADFEDHLKEFFEEGGEETVIKEQTEVDFSEVLSETDKGSDSSAWETFSLADEGPASVEAEENVLVVEEDSLEIKETADHEGSLVFEMDEGVSSAKTEDSILEQEDGDEFVTGLDEESRDSQTVFNKPESDQIFEMEEVRFGKEGLEESDVAVVTEESHDTLSVIQEDNDFIDYIEGVEFDSEEEGLGIAIEHVGEEEVVFEAADEESISQAGHDEEITFDAIEEELDKYFIEQAAFPEKGDTEREQPGKADGFFKEVESLGQTLEEGPVGSEIQTSPFLKTPDAEKLHVSGRDSRSFGEQDPDPLARLRNCVASLGLEINDSILGSLFDEVNSLQNLWISQPAEKTFLQLLSTVAQHIDHYRHEASPEAHGLLMSVFDKLEHSRLAGVDKTEVQESLLSETTKVLLWQQKMLTRKAVEQGKDFGTIFEAVDDDTEKITRIVKDELTVLRQSFRSEMADLLHQYFDKNTSGRDPQ